MVDDGKNLHTVDFHFANGTSLDFSTKHSKVTLERHADWLPFDEVDWIEMISDSVYGGSVFIKTEVFWEPNDSTEDGEEWKNPEPESNEPEEGEALYIFSWSDVESIRLIYKA